MGQELGDSVIDRERAIMVFMLWLVVLSLEERVMAATIITMRVKLRFHGTLDFNVGS